MPLALHPAVDTALEVALAGLAVALLAALFRVVRGPTAADRVVALDLVTYVAIGVAALQAVRTGQAAYLDAATVLALVAFLGTVAFARHVERTAGGARGGR